MHSPDRSLLLLSIFRFYFLVFLFLHILVVGSVWYIKLANVGFRAHVEIASRIVSYACNTCVSILYGRNGMYHSEFYWLHRPPRKLILVQSAFFSNYVLII